MKPERRQFLQTVTSGAAPSSIGNAETADAGPQRAAAKPNRGFETFVGTIGGACSYFAPATLLRDNRHIRAGGNFYYTDAIVENAVRFRLHLKAQRAKSHLLEVGWP